MIIITKDNTEKFISDLILRSSSNLKDVNIIGIDGLGGSGKSTLANRFLEYDSSIPIIHMDDFYLPSKDRIDIQVEDKDVGVDFDWQRIIEEVLRPIKLNKSIKFQKYDWINDKLNEWEEISSNKIIVLEGVYSTRKEFLPYLDCKIWVDCNKEERLRRAIERDGEVMKDMWVNNWMVQEDKYVREHKSFERADYLIDCS